MKRLLLPAAVLFGAYQLIHVSNSADNVQVIVNPRDIILRSGSFVIRFNVQIINPSDVDFTIKSIGGNVIYKGSECAVITMLNSFSLKARTSTNIIVDSIVQAASSIYTILATSTANNRSITANLKVFTNFGVVNKSQTLTV